MGLITGVVSLARAPVRLTLRTWELGLSSAAEVARLGLELLESDRSRPDDFSDYRASADRERGANGGAPEAQRTGTATVERGGPAEPDVVVPETGYVAPEPGELGPEPDALEVDQAPAADGAADAPPAVPDALIPDHVDDEVVLVAEAAEEGAEEGAGAELHVDPPWEGYDKLTAADIRDRLSAATATEAAAVELYESTHKNRRSVTDAAARALRG